MGDDETMIAIGVGCRRGAAAEEIVALVRAAQARVDGGDDRAMALFCVADKQGEAGLSDAAGALGLPLTFLDRAVLRLAADRAQTRSDRVERMFGLPSIAETAALAGAGDGAVLLVPRLSAPTATCAIAGLAR